MNTMKFFFTFLILLLLLSSAVSLADENYEIWTAKTSNDNYKTWTVTLSESIDPSSVDKNSIFVVNEFNRTIPTNVSVLTDGRTITVTPLQMYLTDHTYELVIKGLRSSDNEILNPSVKMPFKIIKEQVVHEKRGGDNVTDPSTPVTNQPSPSGSSSQQPASPPNVEKTTVIKDIKIDLNSLVAIVTVTTTDEVAMVKLNSETMHYAGNNVYKLSKAGLSPSQVIIVDAFATHSQSSLLERKNHEVK